MNETDPWSDIDDDSETRALKQEFLDEFTGVEKEFRQDPDVDVDKSMPVVEKWLRLRARGVEPTDIEIIEAGGNPWE